MKYKNLYRWEKVFIGGSAVFKDTDECAEGARVTISSEDQLVGKGTANNYGEFIIDRLDPGTAYTVTVEADGYQLYTTTVTPDESVNLGTIFLEKVAL